MPEKNGEEELVGAGIWLPEKKGDEIEGEITDMVEGTYGNQYVIKTDDSEEIRTPSHKVLQNRMAKIKKGDSVRIVFEGEEPPSVKGQNPTKMYSVFRKKK